MSSRNLRLRHLAAHLHALGPRSLFEFLAETIAEPGHNIMERLERYGRIDPDWLHSVGGDQLPPMLFVLRGGRK